VARLRESLTADDRPFSVRALSYFPLAMAHQRLGHTTQARDALNAGAHVLDHWTEEMCQVPADASWIRHLGAVAHWPVPWWDWLEGRLLYREAKLLIDGSPPSDDPRIHVLRARGFAGVRWHSHAENEYNAALKRQPDDPQIQLEAHRNRGYGAIQFRHWKKVAAEFEQAWELKRDDVYLGVFSAVAHLATGEVDAYRRTCAELVHQFETTADIETVRNVLLACVLRPDTLSDMSRLLPLARKATPPNHFGTFEVGAALFRAGKYEEAVHSFEAASKVYHPRPAAWCFLAMAQHRLGRAAAARRALDEFKRWKDAASHALHDDPTATRPAWSSWHESLECAALFDEATKLLKQDFERLP
jgi:tetratricopeptide (TPR) repeat protein